MPTSYFCLTSLHMPLFSSLHISLSINMISHWQTECCISRLAVVGRRCPKISLVIDTSPTQGISQLPASCHPSHRCHFFTPPASLFHFLVTSSIVNVLKHIVIFMSIGHATADHSLFFSLLCASIVPVAAAMPRESFDHNTVTSAS